MPWQWSAKHKKWVEVHVAWGRHIPIDSRISTGPIPYAPDLFDTKPTWVPIQADAHEIKYEIRRMFTVSESIERTHVNLNALWGEVDCELDDPVVAKVEILSVRGFDRTHFCTYCEAFSTNDPTEHHRCACGAIGHWKPIAEADGFSHQHYVGTSLERPDWAR